MKDALPRRLVLARHQMARRRVSVSIRDQPSTYIFDRFPRTDQPRDLNDITEFVATAQTLSTVGHPGLATVIELRLHVKFVWSSGSDLVRSSDTPQTFVAARKS
jgi:hypothetical protein